MSVERKKKSSGVYLSQMYVPFSNKITSSIVQKSAQFTTHLIISARL